MFKKRTFTFSNLLPTQDQFYGVKHIKSLGKKVGNHYCSTKFVFGKMPTHYT